VSAQPPSIIVATPITANRTGFPDFPSVLLITHPTHTEPTSAIKEDVG
jgi:hypothetical protein